jgi:hypothetical protein
MATVSLGRNNPLIRRLRSHANPSIIYRSVDGPSRPSAPVAPFTGGVATRPVQVSRAVVQPRNPGLPLGMVIDYDPGAAQPLSRPAADLQRSQVEDAIAAVESSGAPAPRRPARQPEPPVTVQRQISPELPAVPPPVGPAPRQTDQESAPPASRPATAPSTPIQRAPDAGAPARPAAPHGDVPPGVDPNAPIAAHSTITEGEYARLKAFMEGHQAKLAQEKAEQEALQRTPEWQAQEAERQQEEAERQRRMEEIARRQELAKAGRLPRAKVSYVSDPSAPVPPSAGPRPAPVQAEADEFSKAEKRSEAPADEASEPGPAPKAPPVQRKESASDQPVRPTSPPPVESINETAGRPPPAPTSPVEAPKEGIEEPFAPILQPPPASPEIPAGEAPDVQMRPTTPETSPIQRAEERPQPASEPEQPNLGRRLLKAARSILRIEDDEAEDETTPTAQDSEPAGALDETLPDNASWQEEPLETGIKTPPGELPTARPSRPATRLQRSPDPPHVPAPPDREEAARQDDRPVADTRSLIRPPSEPPRPRVDRGTQPPPVQRSSRPPEAPEDQGEQLLPAPPALSEEAAEESTLSLPPPEPGPPSPETRARPTIQREVDTSPPPAEPSPSRPAGPQEEEAGPQPVDFTGQQAPAPETAPLQRQVEAPPAPGQSDSASKGEPESIEDTARKVPLEDAWPVQRMPERQEPAGEERPSPKPEKVVQRKPLAKDEYTDDIHKAVETVLPDRATDSSIELVTPRRPRPTVQRRPDVEEPAEQAAPEQQPPDASAAEPTVGKRVDADRAPAEPSPPLQRTIERPPAEAEPGPAPELQMAADKPQDRVQEDQPPPVGPPPDVRPSAVAADSAPPTMERAPESPSAKPEIISRTEEPIPAEPAHPSKPEARALQPEPYLVPTDVGPLPSDMWEALGETPPPPRPEPRLAPPPGPQTATRVAPAPPAPTLQRVALDAVSPDLFRQETAPEIGRQPEPLPTSTRKVTWERPAPAIQRAESAEPSSNGTQTTAAESAGEGEAEAGGDEAAKIRKLAQLVMPEIRRRLQIEWERGRGRL